jgi:hypothetical protein
MNEQEKQFFVAQKYFLALVDKMAKYTECDQNPPGYLLKSYEDAKCELNYHSKVLE